MEIYNLKYTSDANDTMHLLSLPAAAVQSWTKAISYRPQAFDVQKGQVELKK